jgi:hypothetical protein
MLLPALLAERGKGVPSNALGISTIFGRMMRGREDLANLTDRFPRVFHAITALTWTTEIAIAPI